jgi:hypothetical protein
MEKKIKRIAMLVRIVSQNIETNDNVSDTLWFDDTETICDALYRAADELIEIAECLPNPQDQRAGASPAPMYPVVGRRLI